MAYDSLLALQALVTKTAAFQGTGVNLPTGTPRRGLKARVIVKNYSASAAGAVFTPQIEHSSDNTTYTTLSVGDPLTLGTAAATVETFIPFESSKAWYRLSLTLSPTTGTPTISYEADIGTVKPG